MSTNGHFHISLSSTFEIHSKQNTLKIRNRTAYYIISSKNYSLRCKGSFLLISEGYSLKKKKEQEEEKEKKETRKISGLSDKCHFLSQSTTVSRVQGGSAAHAKDLGNGLVELIFYSVHNVEG